MPKMKPAMTEFDIKLEIQPMRSNPATMKIAPVVKARAEAMTMAVAWSPPASAPRILAVIAATEPAAAKTITFEPPNMA